MIHILIIYFILIIYHAYLVMPFISLTPNDLICKGYILWSDNFTYQNKTINTLLYSNNLMTQKKYKYRIDLIFSAYLRWLCETPYTFSKELNKLKDTINDTNAINPQKFFELKKKGKLSL